VQSTAQESIQLRFGAKHPLQHLQQYEPEIKDAFSHSMICEMDYMEFNESVICSGIVLLRFLAG
jgi:hypothetical protein